MSDKRPFESSPEDVKTNLEELKKLTESEHFTQSEKKAAITRALPKVAGKWNDIQTTLMDIEVGFRVKLLANTIDKMPSVPEMISDLAPEIETRYKESPEHKSILLFNIPSRQTVHKWMAKPEWKEEIERRLKDGNIFTLEKRAAMIESLYRKGMSGDNKSAEMWLKMSGDLTNQPVVKDKALDSFKQISESLFNGKE